MAANSTWLPQLQALLEAAPSGVNPFAWYLQRLADQVGGPQVKWAKPIFIIIAVVSFINTVAAVFALVLKYRQDGSLSLYKMRDHRSGGRYICLNTTTVFLSGHIITSIVFGLYVLLHTYHYNKTGYSYMDLSWAAMMWLAPYVAILLTSTGVLYGVLVAPTALADIRRTREDTLLPPQSPLAGLPCWLLNSFIFIAPTVVVVSILVPAIKLVAAVKRGEELAIEAASNMAKYAVLYDSQSGPSLAEQAVFLQTIQGLQSSVAEARSLWSPTFGLWSGWVALAGVLSIIAFVAVSRVTKARLIFAQRQCAGGFDMTSQHDSNDIFHEKPTHSVAPLGSKIVSQARSDYITLSLQFGLAAVLLFICEVMLLWDTIVGYDVHLKPDLLATAVLVPPIAYYLQASTTLGLVIARALRKNIPSSPDPNTSPSSPPFFNKFSNSHSRQDSEASLLTSKRGQYGSVNRTRDTGRVTVSDTSRSYGIAPSMIHQVEVTQTVEVFADDASVIEDKSIPSLSRQSSEDVRRSVRSEGTQTPDPTFGRAY